MRQGKMVGHDGHALDGAAEATEAELLRGFVLQYYASATHVPRAVILPGPLDEPDLLAGWLSQKRGGPVSIDVPQRGRRRALLLQLPQTPPPRPPPPPPPAPSDPPPPPPHP